MKRSHGLAAAAVLTMALGFLASRSEAGQGRDGKHAIAPAVDVPAGPIWNNDDAKVKCPAVCTAAGGRWNGNWRTVIPNQSSVCGCD